MSAIVAESHLTTRHGTAERPKRGTFDIGLMRALGELPITARRPHDPQRERVYAWEREVLGDFDLECMVPSFIGTREGKASAKAPAVAYLELLWTGHASHFRPYYTGVPRLRVGFAVCFRIGSFRSNRAHASVDRHEIYSTVHALNRATLIHEACHLLTPGDRHGARFCAALLQLWEQELGIYRAVALVSALNHGVEIAV